MLGTTCLVCLNGNSWFFGSVLSKTKKQLHQFVKDAQPLNVLVLLSEYKQDTSNIITSLGLYDLHSVSWNVVKIASFVNHAAEIKAAFQPIIDKLQVAMNDPNYQAPSVLNAAAFANEIDYGGRQMMEAPAFLMQDDVTQGGVPEDLVAAPKKFYGGRQPVTMMKRKF